VAYAFDINNEQKMCFADWYGIGSSLSMATEWGWCQADCQDLWRGVI